MHSGRLALGLALLAFAGCGSGGGLCTDCVIVTSDAAIDAQPNGCPLNGGCNPLAQAGCCPGQKCAWFVDEPGVGGSDAPAQIQCTANGTLPVGAPCVSTLDQRGTDACVGGTACMNGFCEQLCDLSSQTACGPNDSCATYADFYDSSGDDAVAGVCEPACDPLTQRIGVPGTTTAASPTCAIGQACYGTMFFDGRFYCQPDGSTTFGDGIRAPLDSYGYVQPNSCAPGTLSLLEPGYNGEPTTICAAICQPADTWTGATNLAAVQSGVAPHDCPDASENCVYAWKLGAPGFPMSEFDAFGLCVEPGAQFYDPTDPINGTHRTIPIPSCASLGLNPSIDPSTCSAAHPCGADEATQIFGAIDRGCVSYETAVSHPASP